MPRLDARWHLPLSASVGLLLAASAQAAPIPTTAVPGFDQRLAAATTPAARAQVLVAEARRRGEGFRDMHARGRLVIRNARGGQAQFGLEVSGWRQGDASRGLVVMTAPKDIKGLSLLMRSEHAGERQDQWVFLPATNRVKRIASTARSSPFMGSHFTYEDLAPLPADRYSTELSGEVPCGDARCYKIQSTPLASTETAYGRVVTWVELGKLRIRRTDFYDRENRLLKTLQAGAFELFEGEFWVARRVEMTHHLLGGSTILEWTELSLNQGLMAEQFELTSLGRRQ